MVTKQKEGDPREDGWRSGKDKLSYSHVDHSIKKEGFHVGNVSSAARYSSSEMLLQRSCSGGPGLSVPLPRVLIVEVPGLAWCYCLVDLSVVAETLAGMFLLWVPLIEIKS